MGDDRLSTAEIAVQPGFAKLRDQSASRLELLLNRHLGFGSKVSNIDYVPCTCHDPPDGSQLLASAQSFPTFGIEIT